MAGLLDALGYVGSSFDKLGGREVRGLLGGKPRELLAAIPFSDRLGITNPEDITYGADLAREYGLIREGATPLDEAVTGVATEIALDPLNWFTGHTAARAMSRTRTGGDLANGIGRFARGEGGWMGARIPGVPQEFQAAADALGPQYPGGIEKLHELLGERTLGGVFDNPRVAERIAAEIPPGSTHLGRGEQAAALRTPWDSVVRLAQSKDKRFPGVVGRPNIPEMLQPWRSLSTGGYTVEHLPMVKPLWNLGLTNDAYLAGQLAGRIRQLGSPEELQGILDLAQRSRNGLTRAMLYAPDEADRLARSIHTRNPRLDPWDVREHNVGVSREGNSIVFDGGAVRTDPSRPIPWPATGRMPNPEIADRLFRMGSPDRVQELLQQLAAQGAVGQGIPASGPFNEWLATQDELQSSWLKIAEQLRRHDPEFRGRSNVKGYLGDVDLREGEMPSSVLSVTPEPVRVSAELRNMGVNPSSTRTLPGQTGALRAASESLAARLAQLGDMTGRPEQALAALAFAAPVGTLPLLPFLPEEDRQWMRPVASGMLGTSAGLTADLLTRYARLLR